MRKFTLVLVLGIILYKKEANAQLKIGQNPTTVNSNANLQIEATNGNQMIVTKDAGSVGVGTLTPNASAALDLQSTNKGFLLPRVALTGKSDVSTITSPAIGLMVYNTANAGSSSNQVYANKIYIYNGTNWDNLVPSADLNTSIKSITFNNKTYSPVSGTVATDAAGTEVTLGDFSVRFSGDANIGLQYKFASNSSFTAVAYQSGGTVSGNTNSYPAYTQRDNVTANTWTDFNVSASTSPSNGKMTFNTSTRDIIRANVLVHKTNALYRITASANPTLIDGTPSTINIFVERLQ